MQGQEPSSMFDSHSDHHHSQRQVSSYSLQSKERTNARKSGTGKTKSTRKKKPASAVMSQKASTLREKHTELLAQMMIEEREKQRRHRKCEKFPKRLKDLAYLLENGDLGGRQKEMVQMNQQPRGKSASKIDRVLERMGEDLFGLRVELHKATLLQKLKQYQAMARKVQKCMVKRQQQIDREVLMKLKEEEKRLKQYAKNKAQQNEVKRAFKAQELRNELHELRREKAMSEIDNDKLVKQVTRQNHKQRRSLNQLAALRSQRQRQEIDRIYGTKK